MNRFLKGVVVCSAVLLLLAAFLIPADTASGAFQRRKSQVSRVDDLFNQNCARCHGADGRGDTPLGKLYHTPDFTDAEWWKKNSKIANSRTLRAIVTRGKGAMPAFGKKLTRFEVRLLVNRVRSFRKLERKS